MAGGHVDDHHRNQKRRNAVGAALHELGVFDFPGLQSAHAAAQNHADAVAVVVVDFKFGVSDRFFGCHDRELHEAIHAFGFAFFDEIGDVEVGNLGRKTHLMAFGVDLRHRFDAVFEVTMPSQNWGTPMPMGVTAPRPVITTRSNSRILGTDS
jgi:hypothetical protein